jgi:hypothetical protein
MKRVVLCILTLAPTFGQGICATEEIPYLPPHDTLSVNMEDVVITAGQPTSSSPQPRGTNLVKIYRK